jgi:hypothetical protein
MDVRIAKQMKRLGKKPKRSMVETLQRLNLQKLQV